MVRLGAIDPSPTTLEAVPLRSVGPGAWAPLGPAVGGTVPPEGGEIRLFAPVVSAAASPAGVVSPALVAVAGLSVVAALAAWASRSAERVSLDSRTQVSGGRS